MARKSERLKLYEANLSTKMTVSQLKSYIRKATKEVNKSIKKRGTGSVQLDKSIKFLKDKGGVKKEKGIEKVGLGFKGKKKKDLYEQARLLKSHFHLDVYTREGKEILTERETKAYSTFLKDRGIQMSKTEYRNVVEVFGLIGDAIVEQIGSPQIANLYTNFSNDVSNTDFVDIVMEVYNNNKLSKHKVSRSQLLKEIYDRLAEEIEG